MAEQLTTPRGQTTVPAENDYGVLSDTKSTTPQNTDNSPPTREEIQRVLQYLLSQNTPGIAENLMEKFGSAMGGKKKSKSRRNKTSKRNKRKSKTRK